VRSRPFRRREGKDCECRRRRRATEALENGADLRSREAFRRRYPRPREHDHHADENRDANERQDERHGTNVTMSAPPRRFDGRCDTVIHKALFALMATLVTAPALADTVADVEAATQQWIAAFNRKSASEIVALYAKDAVFFGTTSPVLRDTPELVR